jgi:CDP-diacylglycerol--serine O-phosphatidyltransferase
MHGIQMDSLADMTTFGVAPAVLCAVLTHSLKGTALTEQLSVYLLCSVYLGCAALRLATYNVHAMEEHKSSNYFSGLPSPGAAAAVCVAVWLACDLNFTKRELAMVLPAYAAILGLLMVSKIRYLHVGKWLTTVKRSRKKIFLVIVMLTIIALFRIKGLAVLVALYILSGPVLALWRKIVPPKTVLE